MSSGRKPGQGVREWYWSHQPSWMKKVTYFVAVPIWLLWMYLVLSGVGLERPRIALVVFATFGGIVLLQMVFMARAFWRMDI